MVPALRVLFVAIEAMFTVHFWALGAKTEYGYGVIEFYPQARRMLPYDGLCFHRSRPCSANERFIPNHMVIIKKCLLSHEQAHLHGELWGLTHLIFSKATLIQIHGMTIH